MNGFWKVGGVQINMCFVYYFVLYGDFDNVVKY